MGSFYPSIEQGGKVDVGSQQKPFFRIVERETVKFGLAANEVGGWPE